MTPPNLRRWSPLVASVPFLTLFAACTALDGDSLDGAAEEQGDTTEDLRRRRHDAGASDAAPPPTTIDAGADTGTPPPPPPDASAPPPTGVTPTLYQPFDGWSGTTSPDGVWRIAGVWTGTGGNTLSPANAMFAASYGSASGVLLLTSRANTLSGGEIQTLPTYGYGYYETSMKVSSVSGVCDSFFWIETNYGAHEWDVEFLTNEAWLATADTGKVHLTIHPSEKAYIVNLPFNPSKDFHRYGFLWKPGTLDFTVDGQVVHSFADPSIDTTVKGYIMMNTWTGNPNWGGGPPIQDATTAYDWVKFYADAADLP